MVNFLLLIENISYYSKQDINRGKTPHEIYKLCSCIRETFCLSYAIRKHNILYLYFQKEHILIKFKGKVLRYLGPDERSQTLLLNKALKKANNLFANKDSKWEKSTPGIYFRKFFDHSSFINFFSSIMLGKNYLIIDNLQNVEDKVEDFILSKNFIEIMETDFFFIPTYIISRNNSNVIELFKILKNIKLISLSKIKGVEDKILYINFRKDQQSTI